MSYTIPWFPKFVTSYFLEATRIHPDEFVHFVSTSLMVYTLTDLLESSYDFVTSISALP